jgi:AsmA protein
MRALKIAGWVLLGFVGVAVLAMALVAWLVDPNDYKDDIAQAVKEETGRDLKLEGDLDLSVFPWLALQLGPAELGNPEGFGPGPFVSVNKVDVGVRLIPLLRGQLQVRRLALDGLQLNLVKDEQGRTNWQDLTEESAQPATEAETAGGLPDIAGLKITDSALDYRDLGGGSHYRLRDLGVETGRLREREPFDVDLAFALDEGEGTAATRLKLTSVATLDTLGKRYAFKDFALDVVKQSAEKGGKELPIAIRMPAFDADLAQQTLAAPEYTLRILGAELSGSLTGQQIIDALALKGTISMNPVSPRELMRELGMEEPETTDPKALGSLAFKAGLDATSKSVLLEDLELTLDESKMTGRAGIEDFEAKAIRFDLTVDQLDLDRYLAPEREKKPEEKPTELPVKELEALNAKGTLAVGSMTLAGIKMSAVKLTVDAKDGLVRVNPSQAKLYGGSHRGNFTLDTRGKVARMSLEEQVSGVDFAGLFGDLFESKRLSGRGTANAVVAARGNTTDAMIRSLDGRVDFKVADGALEGTDLWYELRRARALWKRESPPAEPSTGRTPFRTLQGTATISEGVLQNRDLVVEMDYLKVDGAGTLDLDSQAIDYKLQTQVYRIPSEGAGAEMQDMKAAEIPVRLSGTLKDMKVRPDYEAYAKSQAKQEVEQKKQELTEKLKDKLDKWLGGKKD